MPQVFFWCRDQDATSKIEDCISSVTAAESRDQLSVISPRMLSFRDWRSLEPHVLRVLGLLPPASCMAMI
jgi:hypothetical protein